jgi:hypothetical protein
MGGGVVVLLFCLFHDWLGWFSRGQWYVGVFGGYVQVLFGFCIGGFSVAQWFVLVAG